MSKARQRTLNSFINHSIRQSFRFNINIKIKHEGLFLALEAHSTNPASNWVKYIVTHKVNKETKGSPRDHDVE